MSSLPARIAFIGFGKAATAFAPGLAGRIAAYDRKTEAPNTRRARLVDYGRLDAHAAGTTADAIDLLAGAASSPMCRLATTT